MTAPRQLSFTAATWVLVVGALIGCPASAAAQDASSAQASSPGWWVGVGGGYLAGRTACSNCATDSPYEAGSAYLVEGGVRVNPRLRVGGEVFSSLRSHPAGDFRTTHLLGIVQFRPWARAGFFLKAGYGMAVVKGPLDEAGKTTTRTWGMGVMYGAGWVFGEGRRVSVAPIGATYIATVGDISTAQGVATNVVANGWFAGAVVMFR